MFVRHRLGACALNTRRPKFQIAAFDFVIDLNYFFNETCLMQTIVTVKACQEYYLLK